MIFNNLISTENLITTAKDINIHLEKLTQLSKNSLEVRLDTFKQIMYYTYDLNYNPLFETQAMEALSLSKELLYVHCKMNQFLYNHEYIKMEFTTHSLYSPYSPQQFTWKIPESFMPVFASYVLACYTKKSETPSIGSFFQTLESYLNIEENIGSICTKTKKEYMEWIDEYLGRTYFCKVESLYEKYSENSTQKKELMSGISVLTEIFKYAPESPNIIENIILLLENFIFLLETEIEKNDGQISCLYPHMDPFPRQFEQEIIQYFNRELMKTLTQIDVYTRDFIKNHHKGKSIYPLAIEEFDSFESEYNTQISNIEEKRKDLLDEIRFAYNTLLHSPFIQENINKYILIPNQNVQKQKEITLQKFLDKNYIEAENLLKKFLKLVKSSSGKNPAGSGKDLRSYQLNFLAEGIADIDKHLEQYKSSIHDYPSFLYINCEGNINKYKYPSFPYSEEDLFYIVKNLYPPEKRPTDTDIKDMLHHKDLSFPLHRSEFITFLANFKAS